MSTKSKHGRSQSNWDKIKVTFVMADKEQLNHLNLCSKLSPTDRQKQIIDLAARIWRR